MAGNYTLTVTGVGNAITKTATVALTVFPGAPDAATTSSPAHGETGVATTATLSWAAVTYATTYVVEVATNPSFATGTLVSTQTVNGTSAVVAGLQVETVYYWRVKAGNDCGNGAYSATAAFQTGKNLCAQNFSSSDVPKTIPIATSR